MSPEVVWAGWLALFLVYEIAAALRERGTSQELTLSRTVWRWFDSAVERVALSLFLAVLTAHLVLRWPGGLAVILTGLPVAVMIVRELVRRRPPAAAVLLVLPLLLGADRCSVSWPQPSPSPTVAPTPVPTPEPPPPVLTCANVDCAPGHHCVETPTGPQCVKDEQPTPDPTATPPTTSACPKPLAPGAEVYLNDKPYGQGFDSTVRVRGDLAFCRAIHGDVTVADCHLDGWRDTLGCELELLGASIGKPRACPVWEFRADGIVARCSDNQDAAISCDHFGSAGGARDDPKTPAFEGEPAVCGEQRDQHGPMAGFFTVAHGKGEVRACKPDGAGCGPWRAVDH